MVLVIQPETRWIRDSLVSNMTHLGYSLRPAANHYPKSKTQLAMIEIRMQVVNQRPTTATQW